MDRGRVVIKHQLLHYIKYSLAFSLPSGNALNNNEEYSHNKKSKKYTKREERKRTNFTNSSSVVQKDYCGASGKYESTIRCFV